MENNTETTADNKLMVPAAIIVAGLIVAGAIVYVSGPKSASTGNGQGANGPSQPAANTTEILKVRSGDFYLGNPGAKVVVVEYGDFQCPFCGKWFKDVEPNLLAQYVKTGKVAFVFRDFAFLGEESFRAAQAARCAGDQGKFWGYHDYLYGHQAGENQGAFSDDNLKKFAATLQLNTSAFNACFNSGKFKQAVTDATDEGKTVGVQGTPATFVNGALVAGAQPFSVFQSKIDTLLK